MKMSARMVWLLLAALLLAGPLAGAQATWPVRMLIPEVLSIRAPDDAIAFDFSQDYPPLEFPARYPGGTMPLQLHATTEGIWTVSLEVSDIVDTGGLQLVPASQVLYRVNGGSWLRADGFPQVIHSQAGPTLGWLELTVEFALELTGAERAGEYRLETTFTAQSETF